MAGRYRPEGRDLTALIASLLGYAMAVGAPGHGTDVLGLAMGLVAAFGYTAYILLGACLQNGVPARPASAWIMGTAGLMYLALVLASHRWEPTFALRARRPLLGLAVAGRRLDSWRSILLSVERKAEEPLDIQPAATAGTARRGAEV